MAGSKTPRRRGTTTPHLTGRRDAQVVPDGQRGHCFGRRSEPITYRLVASRIPKRRRERQRRQQPAHRAVRRPERPHKRCQLRVASAQRVRAVVPQHERRPKSVVLRRRRW